MQVPHGHLCPASPQADPMGRLFFASPLPAWCNPLCGVRDALQRGDGCTPICAAVRTFGRWCVLLFGFSNALGRPPFALSLQINDLDRLQALAHCMQRLGQAARDVASYPSETSHATCHPRWSHPSDRGGPSIPWGARLPESPDGVSPQLALWCVCAVRAICNAVLAHSLSAAISEPGNAASRGISFFNP